ncbi:MAG: acetylxylan esterase [Duncaniella sp.]|nr:acetylxylan esterase [Duncaniella sp.]
MKIFRLSTLIILVALFFRVSAVENYPYRADGLWVTVPDHNDWIYEIGEDASVDVEFYLYGMPVDAAVVRYEIGDDMMPADTRGEFTLKNGKGKVAMGTMRKPGFRDLRLSAEIEGKKFEHHIKLGFSPDRLAPFVNEPSDFGEFWAKAVAEDKKYPLTYSVEPVEEYSTDKMSCSLVRLQLNAEGRSMYGYLFIPKGDGKYPAVLCPPGAGVKTIKDPMRHRYYGEGGMIRAEIEIHGQHPAQTEEQFAAVRKQMGDYFKIGIDDPDTYYLKDVYLGCRRFLDLLTSLPEWDGVNLFTQGGSQGGALAITTAALDDRVNGCVANHPALSDMTGYLGDKAGGYPHHFRKDRSEASPEAVRTLEYYDVANFARHLKCPVRMTWGFNDNTCPPTTSYIVYNLITSPKEALLTPVNEHWTSDNTERGHYEWIKSHLRPAK